MSFLTNRHHPSDIRKLLSSLKSQNAQNNNATLSEQKKGPKRKIHALIRYSVSNTITGNKGSLIGRRANGGLAGSDVRIINKHDPPRFIDISGINKYEVKDLQIVTAGGVVPSHRGDVIAILHQYAYLGTGHNIHSCVQLKHIKTRWMINLSNTEIH